MKEIKRYACEFCGTEFADKSKAQACEKTHQAPKSIVACRYNSVEVCATGYPQTVTLRMADGKDVIYKR